MKRAYVDTLEGQIHYQIDGSGESLLLLHSTGQSSDEYLKVMPILAKNYHVVAMDTLGYGKSDRLPEGPLFGDYAQGTLNFLKALNISKTSIVGHLTGSALAVELAATNPELVDKLALSCCPFYTPEVRLERQSDPRFSPMQIKEDGSHLIARWQVYKAMAPDMSLEDRQAAFVNYMIAGTRAEDGHQAIFRCEMEKRLPLIKSPVLLMSGTKAPLFDRLEAAKSMIPRCKTKVFEDGTAFIMQERPQEFAQAVLDFLKNPGV